VARKAAKSRFSSPRCPTASVGDIGRVRFAGNTPNDRAWVRSIFESADADHVLHCIFASDELCKARLRLRNETKPEGLYYGLVTEDRFDEVTRYFVPPSDQEKLHVISYEADVPSSKG